VKKMTLQTINHDTASNSELWNYSTASMREQAEAAATSALREIRNPAPAAREIIIASFIRNALKAERSGLARIFGHFKSLR
jgi:hypothetical protein